MLRMDSTHPPGTMLWPSPERQDVELALFTRRQRTILALDGIRAAAAANKDFIRVPRVIRAVEDRLLCTLRANQRRVVTFSDFACCYPIYIFTH